jgi:hypothetical protein
LTESGLVRSDPAVVFILCEKESPALRKVAKRWKATILRDPLASLAHALGRGATLVVASDEIRSRALASGADEAIGPDAKEKDLSAMSSARWFGS